MIKCLLVSNSKQSETKQLGINEMNAAVKNHSQEILMAKENVLAIFISTVKKNNQPNKQTTQKETQKTKIGPQYLPLWNKQFLCVFIIRCLFQVIHNDYTLFLKVRKGAFEKNFFSTIPLEYREGN